jgi:hypothetical protein
MVCPGCGRTYVPQGRTPAEIEGELEEIEAERHRKMRRVDVGRAARSDDGIVDLCDIAINRGYKVGWAAMRYRLQHKGLTMPQAMKMEHLARREILNRPRA